VILVFPPHFGAKSPHDRNESELLMRSRCVLLLSTLLLSLGLVGCSGGPSGGFDIGLGGGGGNGGGSPVFQITVSHTGNFQQGQQGATYLVTVTNTGSAATSSGILANVQVTVTVPSGETFVSLSGTAGNGIGADESGWSFPGGPTAMRSNPLPPGTSYPSIAVTVNVASNATSPQVLVASVSGGGAGTATAQDSTIITSPNNPVPTITSLNPNSALAGTASFTLVVIGTNFLPNSKVQWNGTARSTRFLSPTSLQTAISGTDIATAGTDLVTISNSAAGGSTSAAAIFTVQNPIIPTTGDFLFEGNSLSTLNLSNVNSTTGALSSPILAGSPADYPFNYPSVAITPTNKFLYAVYWTFNFIEGFEMSGPGFQLGLLASAPFRPFAIGAQYSLAIHPTGKFLYVVESPNVIEEFAINQNSGDLTHASAVTEVADLRVAAIDPAGKFLFSSDLTGGRMFAYQINQSDGSLSPVAGSPFGIPANGQPSIDVVDSSGNFLYASLIKGGIAAFVIDSSTGALTNVAGSPFPTSNQPVFIAKDPVGGFIYVCNFPDGSVDGFAIDALTGVLTKVPGSPFPTAPSVSSIVVNTSGEFVYVSIYPASSIYGFRLDPSTGSLTALSGSPFPSVPNPTNLFMFSVP
jgi:6-phosphogluconolactonase